MTGRGASRQEDRRSFIDGSDTRIIMGQDEEALLRLWREKRGIRSSVSLSQNLSRNAFHDARRRAEAAGPKRAQSKPYRSSARCTASRQPSPFCILGCFGRPNRY